MSGFLLTSQITSYLCRRAVNVGLVYAQGSLLILPLLENSQGWLIFDLTNNLLPLSRAVEAGLVSSHGSLLYYLSHV
jgi:hypothetical protein